MKGILQTAGRRAVREGYRGNDCIDHGRGGRLKRLIRLNKDERAQGLEDQPCWCSSLSRLESMAIYT